MFAKAEWFTKGRRVGHVRPNTLLGWTYMVGWTAILIAPTLMLLGFGRLPESLIWFVLASLGWRMDFRSIRETVWRGRPADVFVIDENTDITQLNTQNYDLSLRG